MKRTGPRTDPLGTPQLMATGAELQLFTVTVTFPTTFPFPITYSDFPYYSFLWFFLIFFIGCYARLWCIKNGKLEITWEGFVSASGIFARKIIGMKAWS